ncbi:hypothetical protein [Pelolinea submarina]|uniref:Uncharacterized protein n=1 Tax=Pelolinea submarina TaxID=913107 RepID=A0A347ZRY3_9CHLR|nr:hypothetical protein [Pelolinea submarina]REG11378.1 hypothetical protein DFR64_1257 [Pelolinea submarina]BBB48064.1 hypothetical protein Pelsub_P1292 [Pelolinea submarina]
MIDFFASITIALIVVMTVVIFLSNQRQAHIMKQMRFVLEDWYQSQMRDRREAYRKEIFMPDALQWLGSQVNLKIVDQGRRFENPPALELIAGEGVRLVVSPLSNRELRAAVRKIESKTRKVSKLVEPLLGSQPAKVQVVERSNATVHEWFEVEIETAGKMLGLNWMGLKALYFYMIPVQTNEEHIPLISFDLENLKLQIRSVFTTALNWVKQRFAKASG